MHADAGGYLRTSPLPLQVSISAWLPWPSLAKQPPPRPGAERGSAVPLSLPRPTASPTQTHATSEHENLQQILKADEFFSPPAVTCKGGLWIRPVSASFAHQIPELCHCQTLCRLAAMGKKATRRSEPLQQLLMKGSCLQKWISLSSAAGNTL